jgi:hypothetical protein
MTSAELFGISILFNFAAFGIVTRIYIWPNLLKLPRERALLPLVCFHMFRFIGLSFLVPGVVSPLLPYGFASEAAYGDLIAAVLAVITVLALVSRASWALAAAWIFNIWGTLDLLNAIFQGEIVYRFSPGLLGAAYYIPVAIVPILLITHIVMFALLFGRYQ